MSGYRETKWGTVCVYLWQEMMSPSTDTQASPQNLVVNVGPDERAETQGPPLITFMHGGEQPDVPSRGGGRAGQQAWDRKVRLDVELWGSTPAEAEALEEQLLIALDTIAHGRTGRPGKFEPMYGSQTAGNVGAKINGSLTVIPSYVRRPSSAPPLGVLRDIPRKVVPTSHEVTVVASDGGGTGEAVRLD